VRAVPRLCEFYLGICLTTEEKARKNLTSVKVRKTSVRIYVLIIFINNSTTKTSIFVTYFKELCRTFPGVTEQKH
jgi:hypothetical protein